VIMVIRIRIFVFIFIFKFFPNTNSFQSTTHGTKSKGKFGTRSSRRASVSGSAHQYSW
jgi:hypothetical protein